MGDRFDSKFRTPGDRLLASRLVHLRGKPPPQIIAWGLGDVARIGHNNGPPLDDETPGYAWRRYRWTAVHKEVWTTPPMGVLKFRVARAQAAGLSYHDYMLTLLDSGRFAQARDRDVTRTQALDRVRAACLDVFARMAPHAPRMTRGLVQSSLIAAYDDDSRHYHNLAHIAAMLGAP